MKQINGNINAIKVIAIFMVLALHYMNATMGGVLGAVTQGTFNYYIGWTIEFACIIAVNLFVLASAYCLTDSVKAPKFSKIFKLLAICWGYGIVFWLIGVVFNLNDISVKSFIEGINPFLKEKYWFVLVYIIMYLIYPYLNVVINSLNKRQHRYLIVVLLAFFSVWPSFLPYAPSDDSGYGIISFVILYLIGSYLKRYCRGEFTKIGCFSTYVGCVVMVMISSLLKGDLSPLTYNFIFNIIGSVAFFSFILKFDINNKIIDKLSKRTFSVYVIHLNNVVISILIYKILNITSFYNSGFMIFHFIISVFIWFVVSNLIDIIACKILDKLTWLNEYLNNIMLRMDEFADDIY